MQDRVEAAAEAVSTRLEIRPEVGLILGSGMGASKLPVEKMVAVSAAEIPGLPVPSVVGHATDWTFGELQGVPVVIAGGRVHGYEGVPLREATFGVRLMAALGCSSLVVTNAAGGIRSDLVPGSLMRITDHLNLLGDSPLVGVHEPKWGARFVDMSHVYSKRWGAGVAEEAQALSLELFSGVYAACLGPQYETPAEVQYLKTIGADAVGMSTVPEVIVARQLGLEIFGMSLISNSAAGLGDGELNHEEVVEAGASAEEKLSRLIPRIVSRAPTSSH